MVILSCQKHRCETSKGLNAGNSAGWEVELLVFAQKSYICHKNGKLPSIFNFQDEVLGILCLDKKIYRKLFYLVYSFYIVIPLSTCFNSITNYNNIISKFHPCWFYSFISVCCLFIARNYKVFLYCFIYCIVSVVIVFKNTKTFSEQLVTTCCENVTNDTVVCMSRGLSSPGRYISSQTLLEYQDVTAVITILNLGPTF